MTLLVALFLSSVESNYLGYVLVYLFFQCVFDIDIVVSACKHPHFLTRLVLSYFCTLSLWFWLLDNQKITYPPSRSHMSTFSWLVCDPHFLQHNLMKCGICYGKVCLSVSPSVTLVSHALKLQDIEISFAPHDRGTLLISEDQIL